MKRKLEIIDNILSTNVNTIITSIENEKRSYSYGEKINFVNNGLIVDIKYHSELHKALEEYYINKGSSILGSDEESSRQTLICLGKYALYIRNKCQTSDSNDCYLLCSNKKCKFQCDIVKCDNGWCLYRVSPYQHKNECRRIEFKKDRKFVAWKNTPRSITLNDRIATAPKGIIANLNLHPEFALELNNELGNSNDISIGYDNESSKSTLEKIENTKFIVQEDTKNYLTIYKCSIKPLNRKRIVCPYAIKILCFNERKYLSSLSEKCHSDECYAYRSIIHNNPGLNKIIYHKIDRNISENDNKWFISEFVESFNENYQNNRIEIFKSNQLYLLSSLEIPEWLHKNGSNQFQDYIYSDNSYKGGYIITRGNIKLGAFLYYLNGDTLYIAEFFISKIYKRQGIGSKVLTQEMLSVVGDFDHVDILCRRANPSVQFYDKKTWLKENHDIVTSYNYSDQLYRGFSTKSPNQTNFNDLNYYQNTQKGSEDSTYTDREITNNADFNDLNEYNDDFQSLLNFDSPERYDQFDDMLGLR